MEFKLPTLYNRFIKLEEGFYPEIINKYNYIWEGIRVSVFSRLKSELLRDDVAHDSINLLKNSFRNNIKLMMVILKNITVSFFQINFTKKESNLLFFMSARKKFGEDKLYWDIVVDPLLENISEDEYQVIEFPYQFSHPNPSKSDNNIYLDYKQFKQKLLKSVYNVLMGLNIKTNEYKEYLKIEDCLFNNFGVRVPVAALASEYALQYKFNLRFYKKLFLKLNPKVILIVCGYGKEALIRAAKSLNIPIVEIQHGVISKFHLGYDVGNIKKNDFTDYFLTFGPKWSSMANYPISNNKIIPIGYKYLNYYVYKLSNIKKQNILLFISQGTIGQQLSLFAVKYVENNKDDLEVVYKLHPGEKLRWKTEYKELYSLHKAKKIKVIEGDTPSLYSLQAKSKWTIGVNSTALYEGLAFKCKTYILNLPGHEYMDEMTSMGVFKLIDDISQIDLVYDEEKFSYDIEEFFSKNSETRFRGAINKILKEMT